MVQRSVADPFEASLLGMRHSMELSPGEKCASPRLARRSVMFLTESEIGIVTRISSSIGCEEEPLPPPNVGVDVPGMRELRPDRVDAKEADDEPEKVLERMRRTSKSEPVVPRDVLTSIDAGRRRLILECELRSGDEGSRSTSYPARTNLPSGGTKLNSPGLSRHLANRTHGWNTGNSKALSIPGLPPGAESVRSSSGTPDILEVKPILPLAKAARGRPDGAIVTQRVSRISTYSSLLVCRTFARRHGIAGPVLEGLIASCCFKPPDEGPSAGDELDVDQIINGDPDELKRVCRISMYT